MNFFIPNLEEFFETILSLFNQSNACLELLLDGDKSGVPIEKIRTMWTNFALYVSSPRGNQTWRWAAYERAKAVVSAGFR